MCRVSTLVNFGWGRASGVGLGTYALLAGCARPPPPHSPPLLPWTITAAGFHLDAPCGIWGWMRGREVAGPLLIALRSVSFQNHPKTRKQSQLPRRERERSLVSCRLLSEGEFVGVKGGAVGGGCFLSRRAHTWHPPGTGSHPKPPLSGPNNLFFPLLDFSTQASETPFLKSYVSS